MPLGQGHVSDFSEDGKRIVALWSTPSSPNDAWAIDPGTGKAAPLRKEPRPSLKDVPEMDVSITQIQAHDGLTLPINVFLPKRILPARIPLRNQGGLKRGFSTMKSANGLNPQRRNSATHSSQPRP